MTPERTTVGDPTPLTTAEDPILRTSAGIPIPPGPLADQYRITEEICRFLEDKAEDVGDRALDWAGDYQVGVAEAVRGIANDIRNRFGPKYPDSVESEPAE